MTTRRVILEGMSPPQIHTLVLLVKAGGRATRSNYSAEGLQNGTWPLFWKSIESLEADGLVLRVGKFYHLTERGRELASQARSRRWR